MSCWRVLPLFVQPNHKQPPQLLVKPIFTPGSYKLYVTDLSNIWAEELDLEGIVDRALTEQSPIEVSKHDTTQLAILLDNIQKALVSSDDAVCRITRSHDDGITLHTSVALPKPLDSLTWKHHLEKRTSITLKNELILPLLVSSHIQHERISGLISTITDRDKAINRLLDQYESSNLDLAAAFPSIGSLKAGKRTVKREQAAKHIPALQPFCEDPWREHTAQLKDSNVTTLGLFQEALVQSTPRVPQMLKSEENDDPWWSRIPDKLAALKDIVKIKEDQSRTMAPLANATSDSSDDETEDEFETHENFKKRNAPPSNDEATMEKDPVIEEENATASTEDEDDLDFPLNSRNQSQNYSQNQSQKRRSTPPTVPLPLPIPTVGPESPQQEAVKPTIKYFRIGGKAKHVPEKTPSPTEQSSAPGPDPDILPSRESVPPSELDSQANITPRKARRQFKIGGKGKSTDEDPSQRATASPRTNQARRVLSPTAEPPSSPPISEHVKEETHVQSIHEETPEEKAARKRAELKRKNDEAAKKQAGQRKKKRF